MGRRWVPLVIVFVGSLLGLAVAGLPSRHEDPPLAVRTDTSVVASTTTTAAPPPTGAVAAPTTTVRQPGEVKVTAVNSSSVTGAASRMGARLKSLGYVVQPPGPDRRPQDASAVMYEPGFDAEARALASSLGLDAGVVQPIGERLPGVTDTDLAVLIGTELARRTT